MDEPPNAASALIATGFIFDPCCQNRVKCPLLEELAEGEEYFSVIIVTYGSANGDCSEGRAQQHANISSSGFAAAKSAFNWSPE
jgi:hypothetical protein